MHRAVNTYFQTQMTTTTQSDVLLSLYDAAIRFLTEAKERIDAKDPAGKGNLISKALDIIAELDGTLNIEKGKDLAQNLHQLYFFCSKHLLMANLKMSKPMIDEVIKILAGLRDAYSQIANQPEAQAAAREAAEMMAANNTQTRTQPGTASTGTVHSANTPGGALRQRNSYAQAMGQGEPETSTTPAPEGSPTSPLAPQQEQEAANAAPKGMALKGYKLSTTF